MTTNVLKYEVQNSIGRAWELISQHTVKSAALAVAKRKTKGVKVRIVEHIHNSETKNFDTRLINTTGSDSSLVPAPPKPLLQWHKKRQGQSMARILITTILLAVAILGFLFGVSHLLEL
jgi:hypothetical protein